MGEKRFAPRGGGAAFDVGEVLAPDGPSREGTSALRPQDVEITPGDSAVVRAALFMGDSCEAYLEWEGHSLRSRAPADTRLECGDRVRPVFARGTFFAAGQTTE